MNPKSKTWMWCSHVDYAWRTMVGVINNVNSSNSAKVKSVKVLNKLDVACIVLNTSQTPTLESIEWPTPSFNSLALNMLDELATTTTIAKAHCFYLSTFANISYIPLTFGDEELELFPIELEPWFENEAMIFKWEILQLSEKWKKIKMTMKCSHLYSYHP